MKGKLEPFFTEFPTWKRKKENTKKRHEVDELMISHIHCAETILDNKKI